MGVCISSQTNGIYQQKECIDHYDPILTQVIISSQNKYISRHNGHFKQLRDINHWLRSLYSPKWTGWILYDKGIITWNNHELSWLIHTVSDFPYRFTGSTISELYESNDDYFFYIKRPCDLLFLEKVISQLYHMGIKIKSSQNEPTDFTLQKKKTIRSLSFSDSVIHIAKSPKYQKEPLPFLPSTIHTKYAFSNEYYWIGDMAHTFSKGGGGFLIKSI